MNSPPHGSFLYYLRFSIAYTMHCVSFTSANIPWNIIPVKEAKNLILCRQFSKSNNLSNWNTIK